MLWPTLSFRSKSQVVAASIVSFFRTERNAGNDIMQGNDIMMRRQRRSQSGPNGQTESGGSATQDKQQIRFTAILTSLQQTGRVSVDALREQLDVSVVTIRRDLDALEQKGL